jgi:hypothetical protein
VHQTVLLAWALGRGHEVVPSRVEAHQLLTGAGVVPR